MMLLGIKISKHLLPHWNETLSQGAILIIYIIFFLKTTMTGYILLDDNAGTATSHKHLQCVTVWVIQGCC